MSYTVRPRSNYRPAFIENALWFAEAATRCAGVLRIALLGSITTPKPHHFSTENGIYRQATRGVVSQDDRAGAVAT